MTHAEVMERLTGIFRDVFDDDSIVITDQTTANDIEDWDSLEHINLIPDERGFWDEECGRNGRDCCKPCIGKAKEKGILPEIIYRTI